MLEALVGGQRDPRVLAELARGKMRAKTSVLQEALTGQFRDHHGYLLRMMLDRIDALTAQTEALTARIDEAIAPFARQVAQLDVPVDLVDATTGQIRLRCTLAEFQTLRPAQEAGSVADLDLTGHLGNPLTR